MLHLVSIVQRAARLQSLHAQRGWLCQSHAQRACSNDSASTSQPKSLTHLDKVLLKGLVFHGYHGVLPEENVLGQKFLVDATLYTDLRRAGLSDDIVDTISYADVYHEIKDIVEGPPFKLLEAAAEALCRRILSFDHRIAAVQLRLVKPHVAVTGTLDSLGVEITRLRHHDAQKERPAP